jgi:hypothetical protein
MTMVAGIAGRRRSCCGRKLVVPLNTRAAQRRSGATLLVITIVRRRVDRSPGCSWLGWARRLRRPIAFGLGMFLGLQLAGLLFWLRRSSR